MYEKKDIILPYITKTNRRLFSKSDIQRIKCIRKHLDEDV
jgi:DNA-binding transcriptional MerR regulator